MYFFCINLKLWVSYDVELWVSYDDSADLVALYIQQTFLLFATSQVITWELYWELMKSNILIAEVISVSEIWNISYSLQQITKDRSWSELHNLGRVKLHAHVLFSPRQRSAALLIMSKGQCIWKRWNSISASHISTSSDRNLVVRQHQGHSILSASTVTSKRFSK